MKMFLVIGAALLGVSVTAEQAATALPQNYRIQFENEYVRVTSVRYGPHEKLAGHAHTPTPSAYVYLNDGGPVIFRHMPSGPAATRPATKAGAFRVYRGLEEVHEVENTSAAPSEFLRVELKTAVADPAAIRGKFERPSAPAKDPVVQFDHAQMRVSRLWLQPGEKSTIAAGAQPALVIALMSSGGFTAGQVRWVGADRATALENPGPTPIDFLRFDFKTPPAATR
jgi:hypothetical protein